VNPPAFALLRLASPQLPIGGYSYSQGLEMAVERGLVRDEPSARRWLGDQMLFNLARFEMPLLLAHWELRLENRQMGYSLKQLLNNLPELDEPACALFERIEEPGVALGWALAARAWAISPADALTAWLWGWLENQLAVLMKTLPLGQQAAQRLTSELLPTLEQAQRTASEIAPEHWGSAPFGLALTSMAHERQYSRLFRS